MVFIQVENAFTSEKKKKQQQKNKDKLKVDLFTTPDKSFFGSYHHPLGRGKLLIPRS